MIVQARQPVQASLSLAVRAVCRNGPLCFAIFRGKKKAPKLTGWPLVRFPHARPRGNSMRFHPFGFRNTCYQDVDASRVVARMATERCCTARKRPAKSRSVRSPAILSTNIRNGRAVVRLRGCPSPGCAQLKFKLHKTTTGRPTNRVYKRLEFRFC